MMAIRPFGGSWAVRWFLVVTSVLCHHRAVEGQRTFQRTCDCEYMVDGKCAYTLLLPTGNNATSCYSPPAPPPSNSALDSAVVNSLNDSINSLFRYWLDATHSLSQLQGNVIDLMCRLDNTTTSIKDLQVAQTNITDSISANREVVDRLAENARVIAGQVSDIGSNLNNFRAEFEQMNQNLTDVIRRQAETIAKQESEIRTLSTSFQVLKQSTCIRRGALYYTQPHDSLINVTVSSYYKVSDTDTQFADYVDQLKINSTERGGWCPTEPNNNEWVQFDLGRNWFVLGIATRGRSDYEQWATSYNVNYTPANISVVDANTQWTAYTDEAGELQSFTANMDKSTLKVNYLWQPVWTRFVRILPSRNPRMNSCMRADIIGCFDPPDMLSQSGTK